MHHYSREIEGFFRDRLPVQSMMCLTVFDNFHLSTFTTYVFAILSCNPCLFLFTKIRRNPAPKMSQSNVTRKRARRAILSALIGFSVALTIFRPRILFPIVFPNNRTKVV